MTDRDPRVDPRRENELLKLKCWNCGSVTSFEGFDSIDVFTCPACGAKVECDPVEKKE